MQRKIYWSTVDKYCKWPNCKRGAHSHVEKNPYCSTHYRLAKEYAESEQVGILIKLLESVLEITRDDRIVKMKNTYLKGISHKVNSLPSYRRRGKNGNLSSNVIKMKIEEWSKFIGHANKLIGLIRLTKHKNKPERKKLIALLKRQRKKFKSG